MKYQTVLVGWTFGLSMVTSTFSKIERQFQTSMPITACFHVPPPHSDHSQTVLAQLLLEKWLFVKKLQYSAFFLTILIENNYSKLPKYLILI